MIDFKKKIEELDREENPEKGGQEEPYGIKGDKKTRRITRIIISILVIGIIFAGKVLISSQTSGEWFGASLISKVKRLTESDDNKLKGESQDRINILLLGMGGKNHDGGNLTDTIMLASIKPSTKQVALMSIPRDLVVPTEGYGWRKINSINALAESKEEGSGGQEATDAFSQVFQTKIDYYIRIDFQGFIDIIDELGGIQVNVENTLDDYSYPIRGEEDNPDYYARFEHLHIEAGPQKMDGNLALKYARSRHAIGAEGNDFARAKRQQLILEAVKDKLLAKGNLLKPVMISRIISKFSSSVSTNLSAWELVRLWESYRDIDRSQIINFVFSNSADGMLYDSKGEDGAYILMPVGGNFNNINDKIANIFSSDLSNGESTQKEQTETEPLPKLKKSANIIVLNGTWTSGLANKTASSLEEIGFDINQIGNAPTRDYESPLVYDLSFGEKKDALEYIKQATGAKQTFDAPSWLKSITGQSSTTPDFLLILGSK